MSKVEAENRVANYLRLMSGGTVTKAFSLQAEEIVSIILEEMSPADIGMEKVNKSEALAWPWWRYPELETREQFRGHGQDRYKEKYPL